MEQRLVRVSSSLVGGVGWEGRKFRFRSQQENYPRIGNVKLAGLARFQLLSLSLSLSIGRESPLSLIYEGFVLCRAFCAVAFKHISERGRGGLLHLPVPMTFGQALF